MAYNTNNPRLLPVEYIKKWFYVDLDGQLWRTDSGIPYQCTTKYPNGKGKVTILGETYYTSRVIWALAYNEDPGKSLVDHVDGDYTNNRVVNLRLVNHAGNAQNRKVQHNNSSGYPGVYYYTKADCWGAQIFVERQRVWLGTYKTKEAAIAARKEAEEMFHLSRRASPMPE